MEGVSPETFGVLRSATSLGESTLETLCQLVFKQARDNQISGNTDKIIAKHFPDSDAAKVKQVHGALLEFVLECARADLESEEIASHLEEANVSETLSNLLVEGFGEQKGPIRVRLQKIGHSFPQVIGMNWRLDYTLRSSSGGKVMLPTYVISMKTLDGSGNESDVQFTCNREQLKDFLRKVEDAETQVERAIGSTK